MARVDPEDDEVWRYVVHQCRYDPRRRERRNVVVAAFDNSQEFDECFQATSDELRRRRAAGADVDPRERVSGMVYEPGYRRRAANGRLLQRAITRRVPLGPWADELELPPNVTFVRLSTDQASPPAAQHPGSANESGAD